MAGKVSLFMRVRGESGARSYVSFQKATAEKLTGSWYLRYRENGRRCWEPVGDDKGKAIAARLRKEQTLAALKENQKLGIQVIGTTGAAPQRILISDAITKFLAKMKLRRAKRTAGVSESIMTRFQAWCPKKYLHEITVETLMEYAAYLRGTGLADRTVANHFDRIVTLLKSNDIRLKIERSDRPQFDEKVPDAYSPAELRSLFAHATAEERIVFEFFLGSGCREGEVANARWQDVNFTDKTFVVRSRPMLGFRPKDKSERRIPLPDSLLASLQERRRKRPNDSLIFPNTNTGGVEGHFLRWIKRVALRAGLNCGQCINRKGLSCAEHAVCDNFELHKFRRSFATLHSEAGVSPRQIQDWLGHSSLTTTLAYLAVADARSEKVRTMVNHSFEVLAQPLTQAVQ